MNSFPLLLIFIILYNKNLTLCYKAAVFQHQPLKDDTPERTILRNIDKYMYCADQAKSQSAEIVVFPEYGLMSRDADPQQYAIKIDNNNHIVEKLQNIAAGRQIYMVVNLLEKMQDEKNKTKFYNTNLVFNRNGEIILKYRKINLFNETEITPGEAHQNVTFATSFGVTFGLFTSLDIMFKNPSRRVLENNHVTDVIYTSTNFSTMPFFTDLGIQYGYVLANGLNLLAANSGRHSGSGIYMHNGQIAEVSRMSSSKVIIQDVTKIDQKFDRTHCTSSGITRKFKKSDIDRFYPNKDFYPKKYKFEKVNLSQKKSSIKICDEGFCCTFNFDIASNNSQDIYRVMAFDGNVLLANSNQHFRICSLLACETDSDESCGNKLNSTNTIFAKLNVTGNFQVDNETFYFPVSVDSNFLPLPITAYCYNQTNTNSFVQLLATDATNVFVFGILGKTSLPAANKIIESTTVTAVDKIIKKSTTVFLKKTSEQAFVKPSASSSVHVFNMQLLTMLVIVNMS